MGVTDLADLTLNFASRKVFEVLENVFDRDTIANVASILYSSRSGLKESEIVEIISQLKKNGKL